MNNTNLNHLMEDHASAKKKMTLGIVFTAVGADLFLTAIFIIYLWYIAIILVLLSLPFFGVGIPFLIVGVVGRAKANKAINSFKAEAEINGIPAYTAFDTQYAQVPVTEQAVQPANSYYAPQSEQDYSAPQE